ncbi:MAG: His/Gly/Thr/Pro-type tRNA ligase C-terminal domain-containing protein, partial [Candidatus Puniceispirillaceae bacterium]
QYSGRMPAWLSPVQLVVAAITDSAHDYAKQVHTAALVAGMRAELDTRNEKIGYKIREHSTAKVPFILAVGGREAEAGTVALRRLGSDKQEIIQLDEVMAILADESLPPDQRRSKA